MYVLERVSVNGRVNKNRFRVQITYSERGSANKISTFAIVYESELSELQDRVGQKFSKLEDILS